MWCRERFDEGLFEVRSVAMRLNVSEVVAARATGTARLPQARDCARCENRSSCEWSKVAATLAEPAVSAAAVNKPGVPKGLAN